MEALEAISPEYVAQHAAVLRAAPLVVCDANVRPDTLRAVAQIAAGSAGGGGGVPLWLEPVSVPKAVALSSALGDLSAFAFVSPNEDEAIAMAAARPSNRARPAPPAPRG